MIKTLYDERVYIKGKKSMSIEIAKDLLDILDVETIAEKTKLTIDEVKELKQNLRDKK